MADQACVCCGRVAVAEVEVSAGLLVGVCADHLARRREAESRRAVDPAAEASPS